MVRLDALHPYPVHTSRPRAGRARKAWDAICAKGKVDKLDRLYYDRARKAWVGLYVKQVPMTHIRYYPKVPLARIT